MEKNLIDIIAKSGIVGAGGAGFPTHVKMNAKAEYVIINGAECEPLLRVDQQLMAVETKKILDALKLCMKAVGADKGVIALKGHYEAELTALTSSWESMKALAFISFQTSIRLVMNRLQYTKLREELYQKVEFLYSVALSFPM